MARLSGPCRHRCGVASVISATVIPAGASSLEEVEVAVVRTAEADVVRRAHHHGAVVDHLAVLVAERPVPDLADAELRHVARDDAVDERERAGAGDVDLAQHREVHQRRRLAAGAVLLERVRDDRRRPVAEQVHPLVRHRLQAGVERRSPCSLGHLSWSRFAREDYKGTGHERGTVLLGRARPLADTRRCRRLGADGARRARSSARCTRSAPTTASRPYEAGLWRVLGDLPAPFAYDFEQNETIHVLEGCVVIDGRRRAGARARAG